MPFERTARFLCSDADDRHTILQNWILRSVLVVAILAGTACGSGGGSGAARPTRTELSTVAYVLTECLDTGAGWWGSQSLRVQTDGFEHVIVEFSRFGRFAAAFCEEQMLTRFGDAFMLGGVLQRLGVSPAGDLVVFEVSDDHGFLGRPDIPEEQEGMFVVRSDGTGLRRLGPASSDPPWRVDNLGFYTTLPVIRFSPDGTRIAFTDLGPGSDGAETPQVFVVDLATGERRQITALSRMEPFVSFHPALAAPVFVDDETVGFVTVAMPEGFVVNTVASDGRGEVIRQPPPAAIPGATMAPSFAITDAASTVFTMNFPGVGLPPTADVPPLELVARAGEDVLQLTDFGRVDTGAESSMAAPPVIGDRVYFTASTNVLGSNPYENCQLFSMDLTGGDMVQVAALDRRQLLPGEVSAAGCLVGYPPTCYGAIFGHDPERSKLLLHTSCDPLGTNPASSQLFSLDLDGSNMRQLTAARGIFTDADGHPGIELTGPQAYPGVF